MAVSFQCMTKSTTNKKIIIKKFFLKLKKKDSSISIHEEYWSVVFLYDLKATLYVCTLRYNL